jgi:hypothetical protein
MGRRLTWRDRANISLSQSSPFSPAEPFARASVTLSGARKLLRASEASAGDAQKQQQLY